MEGSYSATPESMSGFCFFVHCKHSPNRASIMHGFFLAAIGKDSDRTIVHLIASDVYITRDPSRLRTASSRTCTVHKQCRQQLISRRTHHKNFGKRSQRFQHLSNKQYLPHLIAVICTRQDKQPDADFTTGHTTQLQPLLCDLAFCN